MKETISLKSIGANDSEETGSAVVERWSKKERMFRAVRTLLICWFLAAVFVLIPGLHFVLVPGMFFAGLFGAPFIYRKHEILRTGKVGCPNCHAEQELTNMATAWPVPLHCPKCGAVSYVQDSVLPPLISISSQSSR